MLSHGSLFTGYGGIDDRVSDWCASCDPEPYRLRNRVRRAWDTHQPPRPTFTLEETA